ncbi:hypothetical protein D3C71_1318160 [compost metagenome]
MPLLSSEWRIEVKDGWLTSQHSEPQGSGADSYRDAGALVRGADSLAAALCEPRVNFGFDPANCASAAAR